MKRRLNTRFLLLVVAAASLLGGCLHVVHGVQVKRSAGGLLNQAKKAEAGGQFAQAEDYLSRYLSLRPDDADALVMYGLMLEKLAKTDEARVRVVKVYEKALRRVPTNRDVRRRLVDLEMGLGLYFEAEPHVGILLDGAKRDGELMYLLGRCEEGRGRFDDAARRYEEARAADPTRVEAYSRLAAVLRDHLRAADRADRVMDARQTNDGVVAANRKSARAYLERARYRRRYRVEAAAAAADVARALALAPDDSEVLVAAADAAEDGKDLPRALKYLTHALELDPKNPRLYQKLASLETAAGREPEAVGWLKKGLEAAPDEPNLRWTLADHLISAGGLVDAGELIKGLRQDGAIPESLDYLMGRVHMARGEWPDAIATLDRAQAALTANAATRPLGKRALLLLGQCYDLVGNPDQRYTAYRRAASVDIDPDPMWVAARLGLASSLVGSNKLDEAIEQYRIVQPQEASAGVAIARLQIVQNMGRPEDQQRWDEVEQTLAALDRADPGSGRVSLLRAETLAARKQLSQARRLLEQAKAAHPDEIELWTALATLVSREETPAAGFKVLDEARGRLGDRVELRISRASLLGSLGGPAAVEGLDALEKEAAKAPTGARDRLAREIANAYSRIGEDGRAAALLAKVAKENPNDLYLQLRQFDQALRTDDDATAESVVTRMKTTEGANGALWRYARARLLIRRVERTPADAAPLAEARGLLREVDALRPSWARVPLAEARIDELNGDTAAAVKSYLTAVMDRGDRSDFAIRRAFELLNQQRRFTLADRVLRELQKQGPLSSDLQGLVADVSFQNHNYGDALRAAKRAVTADSKDAKQLVWLGQLQAAAGEPAEPTFRRAAAVAGDSPTPWVALVVYLAREGQKEKAQAALVEARRHVPESEHPLPIAQCYEAVGRTDEAAALYKAARQAKPDDVPTLRVVANFHLRSGQLADAESCFQRVAEKGGADDAAWARRQLVVLSLVGGDRRRALSLLNDETGASHDPAKAAPEDIRVKAQVLSVQPSLARRREAIVLLESLVDRGAATEADLFLLAQLNDATGAWPAARQRMQKLLDQKPGNPAYLEQYTRMLLRHGRADEAAIFLGKLDAAAPQSPRVVELKARVLHAQKRVPEAVRLLTDYARRDDSRPDAVGALLEEFGQLADAEQMYRLSVARSKRPEDVLVLARFLGRHSRTREALDICDRAWATCPPDVVADTSLVILYAAGAGPTGADVDPADAARVDRRLGEAIKASPGNTALQFALANLRITQGRYDDAEAVLRALQDREKTLSAALNNLAWLLALSEKRGEEALTLIDKAIAFEGETPDLLDTRAVVRIAAGKPAAAVADLESAVAVRPDSPLLYYHLAQAYLGVGKPEDAGGSLKKARSLGLTAGLLHPLERKAFAKLTALPTQK